MIFSMVARRVAREVILQTRPLNDITSFDDTANVNSCREVGRRKLDYSVGFSGVFCWKGEEARVFPAVPVYGNDIPDII